MHKAAVSPDVHDENFHDFFQQLNHTSCPLSMDMIPYGMITPEEVCFLYKCGLILVMHAFSEISCDPPEKNKLHQI